MNERKISRKFWGKLALIAFIAETVGGFGNAAEWTSPLGIPDPGFGITTTHLMYGAVGATFNFGSGPVPYPTTVNGPYTHYLDVNHAAATDTANPFGSPSKPRRSIPLNLPPGSVVEIHGGPYSQGTFNGNTSIGIFGNGSATQPIFVRGVSTTQRPTFSRDIITFGSYVTLENLDILAKNISIRSDLSAGSADSHHLVFRHLK